MVIKINEMGIKLKDLTWNQGTYFIFIDSNFIRGFCFSEINWRTKIACGNEKKAYWLLLNKRQNVFFFL